MICLGLSWPAAGMTFDLPFFEDFENLRVSQTGEGEGEEWIGCTTAFQGCPTDDPIVVPGHPSWGWGPLKFETWRDGPPHDPVFSGERSGRQPIWDPYYGAIRHNFTPPATGDLRLRAVQFDYADLLCDCDQEAISASDPNYICDCATIDTNPPPVPSRTNFDVQGWIILTNPNRTEFFALGVNTKQSWTHLSWATKTDGWNVTTVPREQGWRELEIVVHPYTGNVGDVEFLVNGEVVALGRRDPGDGSGIDVTWMTLGGDPILIVESTLTNTFEEFWYDEVLLWAPCPNNELRFDADGDGDVDVTDFAYVQRCLTGDGDPGGTYDADACYCFDTDIDADVDDLDLDAFLACVSGPAIAADIGCDDAFPVP